MLNIITIALVWAGMCLSFGRWDYNALAYALAAWAIVHAAFGSK